MKVLVATSATQGARRTDFTDCVEGELVWMLDACPAGQFRCPGLVLMLHRPRHSPR